MSIKIKELPELERPYEKLERYGEKALSDAELLAIIIKSGNKNETSVQVAQKLLSLNKTTKENLEYLHTLSLEELMEEATNVMVMGHANPDIDAIGSAIGVYRLAKSLDKNAYIITDNRPALQSFMESLKEEPEYEDVIINKEVAEENIDEDTLLVIVDTHKVNYVESEEVLKKASKIVIIDHHRRSADYIENATLTFQEVYASSAAELVTELLQYAEVNVELKKIEAEALYAGIMMDTKSFTFKTGVRTFEAAAYLRKCGVDIIKVKKWFQSDLESFNKIADIVKKAEIVNDSIAIALCDTEESKDISLLCAKAADELLTISDVTASFVLGNTGE